MGVSWRPGWIGNAMRLPRGISLSLRARFLVGMGVMLLPLVVLAVMALFSFQSVTNAIDDVVQEAKEELSTVLRLELLIQQTMIVAHDAIAQGLADPVARERLVEANRGVEKVFADIGAGPFALPEERRLIQSAQEEWRQGRQLSEALFVNPRPSGDQALLRELERAHAHHNRTLESLDQVHTLSFSALAEISAPTGMRIAGHSKLFYKDPGLSRSEWYPTNAGPGSVEETSQKITIIRNKPRSSKGVTLYPGAHRAELFDTASLTDGPQPLLQPPMDVASLSWESIKEITADKTRSIGDRMINGVAAVGFEFEQPAKWYFDAVGKVQAQLWASHIDGSVLLIEVKYRNIQGQNVILEDSDFRWNVPLDESLFDLDVPEGWSLSRTRTESAEYANAGLAPGVTLQIGPDDRAPLTETEDVARVVRGEQFTHPDSEIPRMVRITVELKPEAMQRLRDYANANPKELIILDFNGQIKVVPNLNGANRTQLSIDLSLLDLPLAQLEKRYFTTTIERNGL